jgi:beta-glucosidase
VDALQDAGIEPFVTLYHWDLPQALEDRGGWAARDIAAWFAEYAGIVARRLADRVRFWATLNEPRVVMVNGYLTGEHPPAVKDRRRAFQVAHHLLLAHGRALQALRAVNGSLKLGIVLNQSGCDPASDSAADTEAAQAAWREEAHFLDPLLRGEYHPESLAAMGGDAPTPEDGDLQMISQPMDFLGVNFYSRHVVGAAGHVRPVQGSAHTAMGWEVHPPALRRLLNRMGGEYPLPPLYITENGAAFEDTVAPDGEVHDAQRTDYFRQHLAQLRLAIADGVDVRGYFAWSLLDNFEWTFGYAKRFGLVRVDFQTQERLIKDSGKWYSRFIGGQSLDEE